MNSKLFHCPSHFELISGQTNLLNDKVQLVSYELSKELFDLLTYCRLPRTKAELIEELSKKPISSEECHELILELDALMCFILNNKVRTDSSPCMCCNIR